MINKDDIVPAWTINKEIENFLAKLKRSLLDFD